MYKHTYTQIHIQEALPVHYSSPDWRSKVQLDWVSILLPPKNGIGKFFRKQRFIITFFWFEWNLCPMMATYAIAHAKVRNKRFLTLKSLSVWGSKNNWYSSYPWIMVHDLIICQWTDCNSKKLRFCEFTLLQSKMFKIVQNLEWAWKRLL